ncbi:histidine kinase [Streptomyces sp. NPDC003077]|uniref:sensor histidine kinase n=1 Tax=Streptomyces sp. NPDC003077 TaxID=3154443 RepID=UPI0033B2D519
MRVILRRWVLLVIGGAFMTPYFLLLSVLVPLLIRGANPFTDPLWQFGTFGVALPCAALTALLLPQLRTLESAAVRSLGGLTKEAAARLVDAPAHSWAARRRTALWFTTHLAAGGVVSGITLAAPPAAVVLLLRPVVQPVRFSALGRPAAFDGVPGPVAGVLLLALVAGATWAGGSLLARCAPPLLGPTPADRLAAAERRAADLATRNRLARELHDAVGHALSAVTLQAGAARRVLDHDVAFARQALAAIEETTRQAVTELDTVLGLLREDDAVRTTPAPTLADLDGLLDRTRAAGVRLDARVEGDGTRLAPVVSREAYRIVQEGLSNALRHAGPVPVRLRVVIGTEDLRITMENPTGPRPGPPTPAAPIAAEQPARPGGGHGLRGIADRAHLLGGEARAATHGDTWHLTARLPLAAAT